MRERILNYLKKHKELLSYTFWGLSTTAVNYVIYFVSTGVLHINYVWSNILSWVVSVLVAFVTNKQFVFLSRDWSLKVVCRELGQFVSARLLSGVVETGILVLFVDFMHLDDGIVKIAAGCSVIILNYIASKMIIFKGEK